MEILTIILEKNNPIYSPGEKIYGFINVYSTKRLKIDSLKCKLVGTTLICLG